MWSRRKALARLGALAGAAALAGCGFQPMYARRGDQGGGITADLAAVEVARIPDRSGQMLRNALEQRLERTDGRAAKRYALTIVLAEEQTELGLRKDNTSTRTNLRLVANFRLSQGQAVLLEGQASALTAFNVLDQPYATVMSEKDATRRAVDDLAEEIVQRLAVHFSARRAKAGGRQP